MDIFRSIKEIDRTKYFIVKYFLESKTSLKDAAFNLAVGQSIGNPSARSEWETPEIIENHCCKILGDPLELEKVKSGEIEIAFPEANISLERNGISHLLVQAIGGQVDIENITKCHLLDINFTKKMENYFLGPKIGLKEVKKYCGVSDKNPLFGGITKPKIGLSPERHLDLVKCLIDNGCNFIKEDEILVDPDHCPMRSRVDKVVNYLSNSSQKVFYCVSVHSDQNNIREYIKYYYDNGANGFHVNFHCGIGVYQSIRRLDLPVLLHYQKSGDRILHNKQHDFHIDEALLLKLVAKSGCGSAHTGMIGGYMQDDEPEMIKKVNMLTSLNCIPALSCGMHAGLIDFIKDKLGHGNWMANVGGALFSHPMGTAAGVRALRQAIDQNYKQEYFASINKWGKKVEN
jgi:ribulose-bisphosphate carboxylase large chain